MRTIRITVGEDGNSRLEVLDDAGEHCLEFTAELERRLGIVEGARQFKAEIGSDPDPEPEKEPDR